MTEANPDPSPKGLPGNGGSRPVPDPTELTDRAIAKLQERMVEYVDSQLAIRDERLDGIDKATDLRLASVNTSIGGTTDQIDQRVGRLADVHGEKFHSIETQFKERDTRQERESRDNKVAVDAAFAAQKEAAAKQDEANAKAIDKSEKATAETIKANQELSVAQTSALRAALDDVKLQVNTIAAAKVGAKEDRSALYAVLGAVGALLGIIIAIAAVISR